MAATNPIRVVYAASATGAQEALSIDWRDQVPSGYSFEVQFNAGASGSVTIESTLDNINDPTITADWVAETVAITADTRGIIGHPVTAVRLNISSLAGGTLTLKLLGGSVIGDVSGLVIPGGGGGPSSNVNVAQVGGTTVITAGVAGLLAVGGNVASLATDSGNPVKIGGVYNTPITAATAGQRVESSISRRGSLSIMPAMTPITAADGRVNTSMGFPNSAADPVNETGTVLLPVTATYVFNGTTWDRQRGNTTGTIVIPPQGWSYAAASGGIVNTTTAVTIKGAAGAGIRNYLSGLTLSSDTLGAATELAIRDGAGGTVLWRTKLQTASMNPVNIQFPVPLYSTANTLLEVVTLTASVTGGVYVDATGYTAP